MKFDHSVPSRNLLDTQSDGTVNLFVAFSGGCSQERIVSECIDLFSGAFSERRWDGIPVHVTDVEHLTDRLIRIQVTSPQASNDHQDWLFIASIFDLSTQIRCVVNFEDCDVVFEEAADVLPTWLEESVQPQSQVFVVDGKVFVLPSSLCGGAYTACNGAQILLDSANCSLYLDHNITEAVHRRIAKQEWESFPDHVGRIEVPQDFAYILTRCPHLVSALLEFLPVDSDVNRAVLLDQFASLPFLSHSRIHPTASIGLRVTRLQWAALRSFGDADVLPAFRKLRQYNLVGRLLLSALCCAIKRDARDKISACLGSRGPLKTESKSVICIMQEILASRHPSMKLDLVSHDEDDSWLHEFQSLISERDQVEVTPEEIQRNMEGFFHESSSSDDSDDSHSVDTSFEEDVEAKAFFDQMEDTIKTLRVTTEDDSLEHLMSSMDHEDPHLVGPATVLLASILHQNREQ